MVAQVSTHFAPETDSADSGGALETVYKKQRRNNARVKTA